ncbi:barstar family protein [Lysobacter capsici]|uniref:barstar family protein n=1 Tax=Lysobacter capsici TaxID=435897 RepID=UPI000716596C|nr:barstar family protein [Lysobacter capsici]
MSSGSAVTVTVDAEDITDADSFHSVFASAFGFPDFYGRNMNAWIDCPTSLDDPDAGMSAVHVRRDESLILDVEHAHGLEQRCPRLFAAMVECAAFVNWRRIEVGLPPVPTLALDG